jgi:myosin heavy subunit
VATLLGCDEKLLTTAMTSREIVAGNAAKPIITPLKLEQAEYTRDALGNYLHISS